MGIQQWWHRRIVYVMWLWSLPVVLVVLSLVVARWSGAVLGRRTDDLATRRDALGERRTALRHVARDLEATSERFGEPQ
jgi:hypothetical protein